ncbi:hypothetical protein [Pseudoalteromonas phage J2-1_QLiu-2017]|nr:hypothetical protein [Pseudoalteromonas phage J2-1_QLiu-2017]
MLTTLNKGHSSNSRGADLATNLNSIIDSAGAVSESIETLTPANLDRKYLYTEKLGEPIDPTVATVTEDPEMGGCIVVGDGQELSYQYPIPDHTTWSFYAKIKINSFKDGGVILSTNRKVVEKGSGDYGITIRTKSPDQIEFVNDRGVHSVTIPTSVIGEWIHFSARNESSTRVNYYLYKDDGTRLQWDWTQTDYENNATPASNPVTELLIGNAATDGTILDSNFDGKIKQIKYIRDDTSSFLVEALCKDEYKNDPVYFGDLFLNVNSTQEAFNLGTQGYLRITDYILALEYAYKVDGTKRTVYL